jgi:hypothetical protein
MQLQINWRIPVLWLLDVWIAWHESGVGLARR